MLSCGEMKPVFRSMDLNKPIAAIMAGRLYVISAFEVALSVELPDDRPCDLTLTDDNGDHHLARVSHMVRDGDLDLILYCCPAPGHNRRRPDWWRWGF
jgi:hypothetical protein